MPTQGKSKGGRVLRIALGAFLVLTCLRVWSGPGSWSPAAQAQIPNAGSQRADLLQEVRRTNQLLQEVLTILRTRSIKVELKAAGKSRTRPGLPVRRGNHPGEP
jgi:hypothetical protein